MHHLQGLEKKEALETAVNQEHNRGHRTQKAPQRLNLGILEKTVEEIAYKTWGGHKCTLLQPLLRTTSRHIPGISSLCFPPFNLRETAVVGPRRVSLEAKRKTLHLCFVRSPLPLGPHASGEQPPSSVRAAAAQHSSEAAKLIQPKGSTMTNAAQLSARLCLLSNHVESSHKISPVRRTTKKEKETSKK